MKMPTFTYHRPTTVAEAVALLAEHEGAKVLAGGQSLLPLMALRLSQPEHLIDIGRVAGLADITVAGGGLTIGALVRHAAAEDSTVVAEHAPLITLAMPQLGHRAIRNRGTICGSLAHADPAAEMPAIALAAGARLTAQSVRGSRTIAAADFFDGYLSSALEPDELLVAAYFPTPATRSGHAVVELSRRFGDYGLVGVATAVHMAADATINSVALAYFGAASTPVRVTDAEASLLGRAPTAQTIAEAAAIAADRLDPPDDNHASRAYRKHLAGVLTRRALTEAVSKAEASR